jgi:hypothetical protein
MLKLLFLVEVIEPSFQVKKSKMGAMPTIIEHSIAISNCDAIDL